MEDSVRLGTIDILVSLLFVKNVFSSGRGKGRDNNNELSSVVRHPPPNRPGANSAQVYKEFILHFSSDLYLY